jgi:hypothetical protein
MTMLVCSSRRDSASAMALDFVCRGEEAKNKQPHAVGSIVVFFFLKPCWTVAILCLHMLISVSLLSSELSPPSGAYFI